MEIKKGIAPNGHPYVALEGCDHGMCIATTNNQDLRLEIRLRFDAAHAYFTQEQIKTLLPYLQSFAETGELEPQQSTLQGEDERIDAIANASAKRVLDIIESLNSGIASMQDVVLAMAQNIVEQGKRIRAFEQLVREWKSLAESQKFLPSVLDDLQERTSQLLGE